MAEKIKSTKSRTIADQVGSAIDIPKEMVKIEKRKINFESLSFWAIGLVVFLLPIFFLPVSVLGLSQTKFTILALGTIISLCFFVTDRIKKGTITLSLNPIYVTAILLSVVYFISGWIGISRYKSLVGSMTEQDTFFAIFIGFLFMFLLSCLAKTSKKIFTILSLFFGSVLIAMLSQIARIVVGHKLFAFGVLDLPSSTLVGSWGDITILSLFFLATLVIILETIKLKKWVAVCLGVFLIIPFLFVVLSGLSFDFYFFSIGLIFIIAIASIIIFAYLFSLRHTHKSLEGVPLTIKKRSRISASLIILLISIVLVLFGAQVNSYLSNLTGVVYVEGRPNWQSTYDISEKVIAENPFFGSGPNTFDTEWNLNRAVEVNDYIFWNIEYNFGVGFVPTSLATVGIVGFVSWILFYIFVFILSFRILFGMNKREDGTVMSIVISVGALLSSIILLFSSPGIVVVFANIVFIALLIALNASGYKTVNINFHAKQWQNFVSTMGFIIVLILSIYAMYVVVFKALANNYYRKAVSSTDSGTALGHIQRSIVLDPTQSLYYQTASQVYASKVASALSLGESEIRDKKEEINSDIVNAVNAAVTAEQMSPTDYKAKVVTGKILEFFGSIGLKDANEGAIQKYISASTQAPTNPLPLLFISNVALNMNNKLLAKEYLTKAISLKSDYSDVPDLGREIQGLIDQLNESSIQEIMATTTDKSKNE